MINTIFYFVNDASFDYEAAVQAGDISGYTIVFNEADRSIHLKGLMFGRMDRPDIVETLGNISDLIPAATSNSMGGIKIGYTNNADESSRRYGVKLDESNKAYVEVPWINTITPSYDDTNLRNLINELSQRIDAFTRNMEDIVDLKNRQLFADTAWVREIFGNAQTPGTVMAQYWSEMDLYLLEFNVWEYIDPEHPELGKRSTITSLQTADNNIVQVLKEATSWTAQDGDWKDYVKVTLRTFISDTNNFTSDMEETIRTIGGDIEDIQGDINDIQGDITNVQGDITNIQGDLDNTNPDSKIGQITRNHSNLQQTVNGIIAGVDTTTVNLYELNRKESNLEILANLIEGKVIDTQNTVRGHYKLEIVSSPSNAASAIEVSTISTAIAEKATVTNNEIFNYDVFEHFPANQDYEPAHDDVPEVPEVKALYKNSVPQYFVFTEIDGLTVTASKLTQRAESIEGSVARISTDVYDTNTGLSATRTYASNIRTDLTTLQGRVSTTELRADDTDIALSDLELSVNSYYTITIVSSNPNAVLIDTIAKDATKFASVVADLKINSKLFNTLPTLTTVYKNATQYFQFVQVKSTRDSIADLSTSLSLYSNTNGNIDKLVKLAASALQLKTSENAQGYLSSAADLSSVITTQPDSLTGSYFSGYSGLASKVQLIDGLYVSQSSLTSQLNALSGENGAITTAIAGLSNDVALNYDTKGSADTALNSAKEYADTASTDALRNAITSANATMYASVDKVIAAMGVNATKNQDGTYNTIARITADDIVLNGTTFANTILAAKLNADVLTAGTANIKAHLIVGGSDPAGAGTPGTITMKNASDGTIGIWDKDKLAVATGSTPVSSNSAMLINSNGSGSLANGNVSWNSSGDVTIAGDVQANTFIAGDVNGLNVTTSAESFNFNYAGTRLAWFSLLDYDDTTHQFVQQQGTPQGFYLYMISPHDGHLITIDFAATGGPKFVDKDAVYKPVHTDNSYKSYTNRNNVPSFTNHSLYYSDPESGQPTIYYSNSELTSTATGTYYKASGEVLENNSVDYDRIIYSRTNYNTTPSTEEYYLVPYHIYEEITFNASGQQGIPVKTGVLVLVIWEPVDNRWCYVTPGTQVSVSSPDSTIMDDYKTTLNTVGEGGWLFGQNQITFTPVIAGTEQQAKSAPYSMTYFAPHPGESYSTYINMLDSSFPAQSNN